VRAPWCRLRTLQIHSLRAASLQRNKTDLYAALSASGGGGRPVEYIDSLRRVASEKFDDERPSDGRSETRVDSQRGKLSQRSTAAEPTCRAEPP